MFNIFKSAAPGRKPPRTNFDLSHDVKLSTQIGRITPFLCQPILPGDKIRLKAELYTRFAPLLSPAMVNIDAYIHFFFVPSRLVYQDFEKFITGGVDGQAEPVYPRFRVTPAVYKAMSATDRSDYFGVGSLIDYLGFPPIYSTDPEVITDNLFEDYYIDALPVLGVYLCWYRYYRDQNLDYGLGSAPVDGWPGCSLPTEEDVENIIKGFPSGVIDFDPSNGMHRVLFSNKFRAWEKDYFTSALPWAQRGPELMIPGMTPGDPGSSASYHIEGDGTSFPVGSSGHVTLEGPPMFGTESGDSIGICFDGQNSGTGSGMNVESMPIGTEIQGPRQPITQISGQLHAESKSLSSDDIASALRVVADDVARMQAENQDLGTINNLRRMLAIQRFTEAEARGGSRYPEWLMQIFGTQPGDYRLQQPVYIGGGKSRVVISEVLQQSAETTIPDGNTSPLGEYAGRAVTAGSSKLVKYKFKEHGWLFGFLSFRPRTSYLGGFPRYFNKTDRFEYGNPYFAHLGEQEVKRQEVMYSFDTSKSTPDINHQTFGYQSRFAEYKYMPSRVCGDMRTSLKFWHLARFWYTAPSLNRWFVYINPEQQARLFAVEKTVDSNGVEKIEDQLYCQINVGEIAKRSLPRYGIPS